jgi:hypothetical protein
MAIKWSKIWDKRANMPNFSPKMPFLAKSYKVSRSSFRQGQK